MENMNAMLTFSESEVKELLTGLLKEIEAKSANYSWLTAIGNKNLVDLSDIRTLFDKIIL